MLRKAVFGLIPLAVAAVVGLNISSISPSGLSVAQVNANETIQLASAKGSSMSHGGHGGHFGGHGHFGGYGHGHYGHGHYGYGHYGHYGYGHYGYGRYSGGYRPYSSPYYSPYYRPYYSYGYGSSPK